jgi:integrase
MIEAEPVCHPRAAVMSHDQEALVTVMAHHVDLVLRHGAKRIVLVPMSVLVDSKLFGTHSLRRTKATLIYRRTGNLRAVQLLLGHTKIESTVRYLGIEVDDALAVAEQIEV